jgi:hypothetical protein
MTFALHTSVRNAFLARRGKKCRCVPYSDILNKTRWLALGFVPKTKARPAVVRIWHPHTQVDRIGSRLVSARYAPLAQLFCRCQVEQAQPPARRAA